MVGATTVRRRVVGTAVPQATSKAVRAASAHRRAAEVVIVLPLAADRVVIVRPRAADRVVIVLPLAADRVAIVRRRAAVTGKVARAIRNTFLKPASAASATDRSDLGPPLAAPPDLRCSDGRGVLWGMTCPILIE
jgi:hypothetical protein